jgi:MFS family permease
MPMMIGARLVQGCSAALMMPTTMAIVSATFPPPRRGFALGVLAGGSAFFAALGPVLGGILTSLDWRLVFLVNVPLAVIAGVLTLSRPDPRGTRPEGGRVDVPGAVTLALALGALVYGLSQGQASGWGSTVVVVSVGSGLVLLAAFVGIEQRSRAPLIEFRLLRHPNFLAANISQLLAGMVELGLGYLLPYLLLLVIGVDPLVAGIALIPSTLPIVLAGPLAGRAFDRIGGRAPLVVGFLLLAASGIALALAAGAVSAWALIPGLVLQGPARDNPVVQLALQDLIDAHISGFRLAFIVSAVIAVVGALACFALVRQKGREVEGPIFTRRSRWILAHPGSTPAVTRRPPETH